MNKHWAVQDAKAKFSELLNACLEEGPQVVTKRGHEAAVLITIQEWNTLKKLAKPSLKSLLLSEQAKGDLVLPKRGQGVFRKSIKL
ncbi:MULTISPECIES: type II toxin-antitoxin system Phd/YefM family antitoxin [unclassified Polynucleobacter]|jgi:prevent-host-death family protein|uniref:type II toxin-antitoxin system Phd/YefM family antitoxin n=1 Tax=unclassified Polynucleobacter TaxID=2640945 RepID=UPI0008F8C8F3|nr:MULTISPECIES: type II toxin-antitoxin system Phd/YefM family antitoxin [unclassified Polynucleobacter]MBU3539022.1 type II toxin-antitoxin system Phd/YefM family antitoxin [Polynucleobacter sp. UK-Gri1-W3]MBU3617666.1 type II toxin-antitoxin system Phd/YefM family antitoxin [Polynucleobacter sp. JS-Fieb-80-E5]OIM97185.1 prevent-host-death protein [Polynucleobacter sp. QLW-P1DATA-2]OIM98887.1 prevent-host-death protein [Polynucleobacter sp. MWH-Tro8-2-5-gr]QWD80797.1 type II toxin-antitoxin 